MNGLDVPAGMALACRTCRWRPDPDLTAGVLAAHFTTEHDTEDVQLDLIVVCPRCDQEMAFLRSEWRKDIFTCDPCHRIRSVRRNT